MKDVLLYVKDIIFYIKWSDKDAKEKIIKEVSWNISDTIFAYVFDIIRLGREASFVSQLAGCN